jgi:NAD(P)H dehydrogenase (quinone)
MSKINGLTPIDERWHDPDQDLQQREPADADSHPGPPSIACGVATITDPSVICRSTVSDMTTSHRPAAAARMARVLVLYYSSYGHIEAMALAVADGARQAGADVVVKRVPELVPEEVAKKSGYKLDQAAPIATVAELPDYDAIIIGNMAAQMKSFLDRTGRLWSEDRLVGKIGSIFASSGSQHGGQESTILSAHVVLLHLGMVIVGLPYTFKGQLRMDEITGSSPYGASTLAEDGNGGDRRPSANELSAARFQGRHVAEVALALALGRRRGLSANRQTIDSLEAQA